MDLQEIFLNQEGVRTLWAAIKVELSKKVNTTALENYMTDEEIEAAILAALTGYMTSEQVTQAIATAIASVKTLQIEIVDTLPAEGDGNKIYFVSADDAKEPNLYNEYAWINGRFEPIGTTAINLANYWSKTELTPITSEQLQEILV